MSVCVRTLEWLVEPSAHLCRGLRERREGELRIYQLLLESSVDAKAIAVRGG